MSLVKSRETEHTHIHTEKHERETKQKRSERQPMTYQPNAAQNEEHLHEHRSEGQESSKKSRRDQRKIPSHDEEEKRREENKTVSPKRPSSFLFERSRHAEQPLEQREKETYHGCLGISRGMGFTLAGNSKLSPLLPFTAPKNASGNDTKIHSTNRTTIVPDRYRREGRKGKRKKEKEVSGKNHGEQLPKAIAEQYEKKQITHIREDVTKQTNKAQKWSLPHKQTIEQEEIKRKSKDTSKRENRKEKEWNGQNDKKKS